MAISQDSNEALKNPWVLGFILFFITFVSANIVFISLAFKSPPQLVDKQFYEHGENYAETQKQIEKQKALGWNGVLITPSATRVNEMQMYELVITGKNSAVIELDSVVIKAYRPSDAKADFFVEMTMTSPGHYQGMMNFHLPGVWDLKVEAKQADTVFVVAKRLYIKP